MSGNKNWVERWPVGATMVPPCRGVYEDDDDLTEFFDGRQSLSYADIGSLLGINHHTAKAEIDN
jgi:hypothetical protein